MSNDNIKALNEAIAFTKDEIECFELSILASHIKPSRKEWYEHLLVINHTILAALTQAKEAAQGDSGHLGGDTAIPRKLLIDARAQMARVYLIGLNKKMADAGLWHAFTRLAPYINWKDGEVCAAPIDGAKNEEPASTSGADTQEPLSNELSNEEIDKLWTAYGIGYLYFARAVIAADRTKRALVAEGEK